MPTQAKPHSAASDCRNMGSVFLKNKILYPTKSDCDCRLAFMQRLRHWPVFRTGWSRRVAEVRAQSKAWAARIDPRPSTVAAPAKAEGATRARATLRDTLTNGKALGAVTGILGSTGTLLSGHGPVQYAIAAVLVMGALTGVWWLVKGRGT